MFLEKYFVNNKQKKLFYLLCLTTLLNLLFVFVRMIYLGFEPSELDSIWEIKNNRGTTFLFLVWNLFLAWIPYLISLLIPQVRNWIAWPLIVLWLVFFPNAPYIVTDLLHVGYRPPVPVWYDTVLLFSFAWTGLLLGFISLFNVRQFLVKNIGKNKAEYFTWASILLCAFGVYLGRYQRWNTWDILTNPFQLFEQIAAVVLHPVTYLGTLGLAVVMAGLLGVGYLTLKVLISEN